MVVAMVVRGCLGAMDVRVGMRVGAGDLVMGVRGRESDRRAGRYEDRHRWSCKCGACNRGRRWASGKPAVRIGRIGRDVAVGGESPAGATAQTAQAGPEEDEAERNDQQARE